MYVIPAHTRKTDPAARLDWREVRPGPWGACDASATYSLSPAVICVAEMSSPASEASRHFQSVKAGWS